MIIFDVSFDIHFEAKNQVLCDRSFFFVLQNIEGSQSTESVSAFESTVNIQK